MHKITAIVLLVSSLVFAVPGKFDGAINAASPPLEAPTNQVYNVIPITVECFARLADQSQATIILAQEPPHSGSHWHLYAEKGSGHLAVNLPSYKTPDVRSSKSITDGQWHHLAFTFDGQTACLYVDGAKVADQKLEKIFRYPDSGPLTLGQMPGSPPAKDLLLDEVRISRVVREIKVPAQPYSLDADTIALWHFNEPKPPYADTSKTGNPIRLKSDETKSGMFDLNNRWAEMDLRPFFSSSLGSPLANARFTAKAISQHEPHAKMAFAFDTELLRISAAWTGKFLKMHPGREGLAQHPDIAGSISFAARPVMGWSTSTQFIDPRPDKLGPLPREHGRFKGIYQHGTRTIFSYTVANTDILEMMEVASSGDARVFSRIFHVGPSKVPLTVLLFHRDVLSRPDDQSMPLNPLHIDDAERVKVNSDNPSVASVTVLPSDQPALFRVSIADGAAATDVDVFAKLWMRAGKTPDLSTFTRGGPSQWPSIITKGELSKDTTSPYVVDTLTAPEDNPWKSFLRFGGHDFFSNGDIAVCSISGDVWRVSGINEKLEKLTWKRYAAGLHHPLGLRIVKDKVYVLGRDQITRLHDLNGDNEADFYENFNNDIKVTSNGHAYAACLETDPAGNFYYVKCGDNTEHGGTMLRVSSDGSKLDVFATGLRNPNGAGVSPTGVVTAADNQGEWVPASRLDIVSKGEFLGYQPMSKQNPPPRHPGHPLVWMPQNVDNSSGGQGWVTSDKWGPFKDYMLHTSYGAAALLLVLPEKVGEHDQGAVWRFPLQFSSGIMRARFSPVDGQLYVSGLRGWQTAGSRSGALQRVRYTAKPVRIPSGFHVHKNGLRLSFTTPLDADSAADAESYTVLQWNYRWSADYGSKQWSVENPKKPGYDELEIKSAKVLPDGHTVFLEIDDLQPVMQMQVSYNVKARDGAEVKGNVHNTIHALGDRLEP